MLADAMAGQEQCVGVLLCGSGIGMSIAANRYPHMRAALCRTSEDARVARLHNDANTLVLGADYTEVAQMPLLLEIFLATEHEGGRHAKRVAMFDKLHLQS